ncbi:MAG: hypothetical protein K0R17_1983 [Rariglobus sp.]|jgi:hypothetical protein|nr:hypothetical protein [Rariglobus sp.]
MVPLLLLTTVFSAPLSAAWVWVEGEAAVRTNVGKHPWYYGQVKKELLSGGDFLAHYDAAQAGEAEFVVQIPEAGSYTFWLRANPVQSALTYSLNGAAPVPVVFSRGQTENTNIAANGAPDLRFLSWCQVGTFQLRAGANTLRFVMNSPDRHHGAIDCFVLTTEPFAPLGALKPDQQAVYAKEVAAANAGWVAWSPDRDDFRASAIDLRPLNETFAGENGAIQAKGEQFVHSHTGRPVRFWAVNGPPRGMAGDDLKPCARMLAKRGVNLVRIHGAVFDNKTGALLPDVVRNKQEIVEAMRAEGVYSLLSIYFPLWLTPENGEGWREGYDGKKHPFALLYFEPGFQDLYRSWWRELLTRPGPSGRTLIDDPAIMALELVNEDSFFFWTFKYDTVPEPQMRKLEKLFGGWVKKKHGSFDRALTAWGNQRHARDDEPDGRLGFRPLYDLVTHKTARDQDTTAFLLETQRKFYDETVSFLRGLGYKGMITASNWITANDDILGPLEKYSYMAGDFIDHHGYFGSNHHGNEAGWSIREGHTYSDVSALRFEAEQPGKPKSFRHPAMDPMYNRKPSTISETTWNRPNRYRGEAPLFYAAYGSLQDTDSIMHFAHEGADWKVKPTFFMQPWTLMTPTQMGQFPAAALIYRLNLIKTGDLMADLPVKLDDALALKGSKLVQRANLDELRKADVLADVPEVSDAGIDPLVHFVGRTNVRIDDRGGSPMIKDLAPFIDRAGQSVLSSTREVKLDYGKGLLYLNAPSAQGIGGHLKLAGAVALKDITFDSALELGQIVAVSLDGQPLATSGRILVQAMTEEKPANFTTEPAGEGIRRITSIGQDPWLIREIQGTLKFKRADAARLKVTALDFNGYPAGAAGTAEEFKLKPGVVYYLIEK